MKRNKTFLLSASLGLLISQVFNACAPAYVTNTINTPMLSNKGELQIAVNSGVSGFDPQAAYAITDNFAVMLNGSFDNRVSDSSDNYHKHMFFELAPGYYTRLGNKFRFETFGGIGLGRTQGLYDSQLWVSTSNARLIRLSLQPGIGIVSPNVEAGLAARISMINLNQNNHTSTGFFLEPALTLRSGFEQVKFTAQLGFCYPLNQEDIDFDYQFFIISVGLRLALWQNLYP